MKYEVVGIRRKSGEYEGRPYDNTYLNALCVRDNVIGRDVASLKMKTTAFSNLLQTYGIATSDLVGKTVNVSFDEYRNVEEVVIMDKPGK